MDSQRSKSRRRLAARLMLSALGGMLLAMLALWLFDRSRDPLVAPTVLLTGTDLHLVNGEGGQTAEGLEVRQTGPNGIAMVQGAMRALDADRYQSLSWRIDGLMPEQELRLIWATSDNPRAPRDLALMIDEQGNGRLDLRTLPHWEGQVIAIGLVVTRPLHAPILVRQLELQPTAATPVMLIDAALNEWTRHEGWTGRSINFDQGAGRNALFPPAPLVALWVGFSSLLYALLNPPWRGDRRLAPYVVLGLIGWLALDIRWQWNLVQRLIQTETVYADLDENGRQLAGPDRNFYPFLQEVRRHLPAAPARMFIISSDPDSYRTGRARYHLLPHNIYTGLSTLPGPAEASVGDYLLMLSPVPQVRFDRERNLLASQEIKIHAECLYATDQGALYRIQGGS